MYVNEILFCLLKKVCELLANFLFPSAFLLSVSPSIFINKFKTNDYIDKKRRYKTLLPNSAKQVYF